MKKLLLIFILLYAAASAYDGSAGASLNRADTIDEYARLVDLSEQARKTGSPRIKKEAVEGIEEFLAVVDEYRDVSSSGAKKYLEVYERDLKVRLENLSETP